MSPEELRKIDAAIAEHVMGWKRVPAQISFNAVDPGMFWTISEFGQVYIYGNRGVVSFTPTTSWADCGMVIDKIHPGEKFMNFELVKVANPPDAAWIATIDTVCATGPTKQIAICKLALSMKGVEVRRLLKTPEDKVGPTIHHAHNYFICGMCIHHHIVRAGGTEIHWEHSCKHPNEKWHLINHDMDETPSWCPELKANKV